jgi:Fe-S-cluster containining protein
LGEGVGSFWRLEPRYRLRRRSGIFLNDLLPRVAMRLYDSVIVMARHFSSSSFGDVEDKSRVGDFRVKERAKNRVKDKDVKNNDQKLIQIVGAALADATRRSGKWLVCHPGCTQCCIGVFAINQLDARRLRLGLAELALRKPERAARIRERANDSVARLAKDFPGDPVTGILDRGDDATRRFSEFANDEPCPVLDPATGTCELYESRPVTCRVFGPPVRSKDGLGVCELCFQSASDDVIAACEMKPDPDDLESALVKKLEKSTGARGETIVAYAVVLTR